MEHSDELATVADKPSTSLTGSSAHATAGPRGQKALRVEEVVRARGMAVVLGVICAAALAWFPIIGGVPWLRIAAMIACGYFAIVCLVIVVRARPDDSYFWMFRWFSASAVIVSIVVQYHIGLFSPAPIVVTLGISFFGGADDRRWGVGCCIAAIAGYAIIATLIAFELIPDLGLIRGLSQPAGRLFGVVMVPFVFVGTLRHSLLARRAAHDAMAQVEDAARVVQQRDAQLAEANQDLENALEAGAGQHGRHSGRQAGRWLLGPVIGRGAMGEVYAARAGSDHAAVKTLVATADPDQLARFRREAEISSSVESPGLVKVYDVGVLDGGVPFIAMELLRGRDLAWHLRKSRQFDLEQTVVLCTQVAAGLDTAHRAGIVHRDIKPQNLMLHEPEGGRVAWKILDFGVSKLVSSQGTLTQNMVVGTPGYMSPEQAKSQPVDERSNLFSLGAVIYRSLTGQPPFRGTDTPQILFDVVYRAPRPPTELAPGLPPDVARFLAIAIAKRPANRFESATQLATALAAASRSSLARDLRARADNLLAELPWGGRLKS